MMNMQAKTHQFERLMPYLLGALSLGGLTTLGLIALLGWRAAVSGFIGSCLFWVPNVAFAFCFMKPRPKPYASLSALVKGQAVLFAATIILWVIVLNSNLYNIPIVLGSFALHWLVLPLWGILKS
jgi:F0F1-type ATP synthase assembly protein I